MRDNLKTRIVNVDSFNANNGNVIMNYSRNNQILDEKFNDDNVEHKKLNKIQRVNPYYNYIPKFYLSELRHSKLSSIMYLVIFSLFIVLSITLISLSVTIWAHNINSWILILLVLPFSLCLGKLIISCNKYHNFKSEAMCINFRDDKVLSNNVQKAYTNYKTKYIDTNWCSAFLYIITLLTILVDAIVIMFDKNLNDIHYKFGDFLGVFKDGKYSYVIVLIFALVIFSLTFINHVYSIINNYIRASNIENFYNNSIANDENIREIKKTKNKRDAIIFFAIIGTIFFLVWFLYKIISKKRINKVN